MALFVWNDSYSVKVKEIDNQHKKLINLINQLHDSMKTRKGKEHVGPVLDEMVKYTAYHFSFEEQLFGKYNYPDIKNHLAQHNGLIDQLKVYLKDFESGKGVLPMELLEFLKSWLLNHIIKCDKNYSAFFNEKGLV